MRRFLTKEFGSGLEGAGTERSFSPPEARSVLPLWVSIDNSIERSNENNKIDRVNSSGGEGGGEIEWGIDNEASPEGVSGVRIATLSNDIRCHRFIRFWGIVGAMG